MQKKIRMLLDEFATEFGWRSKLAASLGGRFLLHRIRREENHLKNGKPVEPPTFYEVSDSLPCAASASDIKG
jgi:hypothetical protein